LTQNNTITIEKRKNNIKPHLKNPSIRRPQLERAVIGGTGDVFAVGRNVGTHHLTLVTGQRSQRLPARVRPQLDRVIVRSR